MGLNFGYMVHFFYPRYGLKGVEIVSLNGLQHKNPFKKGPSPSLGIRISQFGQFLFFTCGSQGAGLGAIGSLLLLNPS